MADPNNVGDGRPDGLLIAVTEHNSSADLDALIEVLRGAS